MVIVYQLFYLLGIDTDPDRSDPDWHALDADPDQDPANDADPIRSGSTTMLYSLSYFH